MPFTNTSAANTDAMTSNAATPSASLDDRKSTRISSPSLEAQAISAGLLLKSACQIIKKLDEQVNATYRLEDGRDRVERQPTIRGDFALWPTSQRIVSLQHRCKVAHLPGVRSRWHRLS